MTGSQEAVAVITTQSELMLMTALWIVEVDLAVTKTINIRVRFEVFTAVTMKNGVFWGVTPCGSCSNRRFGGTWRLLHQGDKNL
jgi:hypothetical protein